MKKIYLSIATLIFSAIVIALVWSYSSSNAGKFIGNWKRIDKMEDTLVINKVFDAIIIFLGKRSVAAEFDRDKNILRAHLFSPASVITYSEKTGHLLINNGLEGEFERVK
jgi:hypothetical protein